ncbi:MAG: glycosyl transferase [Proteobacteria bacterium]|nr:glycosyl transferase [Pseudomonadota bacterium]
MTRRDFHFVFGLREQREPFHLLHYLCLASCRAVNRPDAMHFHFRHEPFGPWWEKIKPALRLHTVAHRVDGFEPGRYADSAEGRLVERLGLAYAHEADFLRMDVLLEHGGAYADMDTLFVREYPDAWFDEEFAIGEENAPQTPGQLIRPSLCNAVVLARPGSRFAAHWRERMAATFDGSWSRHSCAEAARAWERMPDALRVLPREYFYRYGSSIAGLRTLLEESDTAREDLYSMHLWAHLWWSAERTDFSTVHAGQIDEHWIRTRDCTLANLARRFLE